MLRGVNLSGNCKLPARPIVTSHTRFDSDGNDIFFNHRTVSFVGRPFPLEDADEHFMRLKSWGFEFLRFLVTWEALEHGGPGVIDYEYCDYVGKVLEVAGKYGLKVFIDPHQDCWSRFTGGSGAPGWTLELVGFDMKKFRNTEAALIHNTYADDEKGLMEFPKMIWPTNYFKLACATMFTLFFGGKDFAPLCMVDTEKNEMVLLSKEDHEQVLSGTTKPNLVNIQDYLQDHYISSIQSLVKHMKTNYSVLDTVVVGYDTLNEPSGGFLEWSDMRSFSNHQELKNGITPTPLQSMLLGEGVSQEVDVWTFGSLGPRRSGSKRVNLDGERCYLPGKSCIWLHHGLYSKQLESCNKPDYFAVNPKTNKKVDWTSDYWKPFVRNYSKKIRDAHQDALIFLEPPVNEPPPMFEEEDDAEILRRVVYTPHWYDGITLMNKSFSRWWTVDFIGYKRGIYSSILSALSFGPRGVKDNFARQLGMIKSEGLAFIGDIPCLIGEIGIPFDMDNKSAYNNGNYSKQKLALDANMSALERNLLNFTLWNYCADNVNKWGDNWNGEDLSLISLDMTKKIGLSSRSVANEPVRKKMRRERTIDTSFTMDSGIGRSIKSETDSIGDVSLNQLVRASPTVSNEEVSEKKHVRSKTDPVDLSRTDLSDAARALSAFLRPYPKKTCGTPAEISFDFESKRKTFKFRFNSGSSLYGKESSGSRNIGEGTEIFLPIHHFGYPMQLLLLLPEYSASGKKDKSFFSFPISSSQQGIDKKTIFEDGNSIFFEVQVSDGSWTFDAATQTLHYFHATKKLDTMKTASVSGKKSPDNEKGSLMAENSSEHEIIVTVSQQRIKSGGSTAEAKPASFCSIL